MTRKRPVKKQKLEIVFDPQKRKEFLSGFQKRKNERRKRAQEQFEKSLKEERKRIKQEIKDGFKHMKKSFEPLRELTEEDRNEEQEYEDDDVKVHIVELSNTAELAAHNTMLGQNQDESESESENEAENEPKKPAVQSELPGMDLKPTKQKSVASAKTTTTNKASTEKLENISSKKDLNRLVKQKTIKKLQKSKVFKQKERLDKRANEKKVKRTRNNTLKALPRHARKKIKNEPSRYSKGRMMSKKLYRKKKQNMQD